MRQQHGVQLAGHVRGEFDQASAFHDRPFAVRAGEDRQDAGLVEADRADELRLLAAHDIGNAGGADAARPGHDGELATGRLGKSLSEAGEIRRAFDVGRLDPALPAADHSAGDPRCRIVAPIVEQCVERGGETAVAQRSDAKRRAARRAYHASQTEAIRAGRRGSPVDGDQSRAAGFGHGPRR